MRHDLHKIPMRNITFENGSLASIAGDILALAPGGWRYDIQNVEQANRKVTFRPALDSIGDALEILAAAFGARVYFLDIVPVVLFVPDERPLPRDLIYYTPDRDGGDE